MATVSDIAVIEVGTLVPAGGGITPGQYTDLNTRLGALEANGQPATRIANGTVDNTEFQRLNGVTSDIQTQLNAKQALSYFFAESRSACDDPTSSSTSLFATAMAYVIPEASLPDGTYRFVVRSSMAVAHSTGGNVKTRIQITGASITDGTEFTMSWFPSSPPVDRVVVCQTFTGIVLTNGVTVRLQYQNQVAGQSATGRNPEISFEAIKTG